MNSFASGSMDMNMAKNIMASGQSTVLSKLLEEVVLKGSLDVVFF